ncbi:MAG: bacillithiol biosynthesis cysteine-adding enzyme BshC [Alicyclobacillus herbarius]|uniref:bacillithiol biosynthesis cysteine-adding enzyme BshC n=1 Tax=Alicyclobacillus herbarius TaxID=122960 RepID=UPI002356FF07|nr:bacillithiol biosynthesis cysteine-adding enzyme BshC [Alicyclobacillus herbarius]MCL6631700.1 bacillithiol biosynthesis cysteine-adding enzyme BshC [Alicyclobacillus herbarius]
MKWIRRTAASGNPLTDLHLSSFAMVSHLYDGQDPTQLDTYRERARQICLRFSRTQREALVNTLRDYHKGLGASQATFAQFQRLLDPKAVTVVTGQQAGLFGGPMFSLYKALSAVGVAQRLESELRCPVIPVFWVASEDHDWAEVDHAYILDGSDEIRKVQLRQKVAPHQMVYHQPLSRESVDEVLATVHRLLAGEPYTVETLQEMRALFEPGMSLATWFARLMVHLTSQHGLVLLDPCLPGLRELAKPVWEQALQGHREVQSSLDAAYADVADLGVAPAVVRDRANTTLFYVQDGKRYVLEQTDEAGILQVRGLGLRKPVSEWLALAQADPTRFSSNVLLRPVVQDTILPTLVYIGGAAEIAYHALARGTFRAHGRSLPPLLLRQRMTLYPASVLRHIEHWEIPRERLYEPTNLVENALGRMGLSDLEASLKTLQEESERRWASWAEKFGYMGAQLRDMARAQAEREWKEVHRFGAKAKRLFEARHDVQVRQLRHIERWLWTDGHPQERRLCLMNFACRQGDALLRELPLWGDYDQPGTLFEVDVLESSR